MSESAIEVPPGYGPGLPPQRPGDSTGGSAATYEVVAALVVAKDIDGRLQHCYRGSIIKWLNDKQRAHFLRMGLVAELTGSGQGVGPDGPPVAVNE
ncbi:hypothetical protein [[Mycobacterium] zoologicum]|uniref:hypothetical protein n=1 Tax=[Mycobacterium] zoologicum TaxID=2872311 RepID=UPI001CDADDB6|nr:hypothetical protein [Mycolicibacter sp. MYC101]MEB3062481.1 hypothetical protein [Mycolicibacter sp. MYC101]